MCQRACRPAERRFLGDSFANEPGPTNGKTVYEPKDRNESGPNACCAAASMKAWPSPIYRLRYRRDKPSHDQEGRPATHTSTSVQRHPETSPSPREAHGNREVTRCLRGASANPRALAVGAERTKAPRPSPWRRPCAASAPPTLWAVALAVSPPAPTSAFGRRTTRHADTMGTSNCTRTRGSGCERGLGLCKASFARRHDTTGAPLRYTTRYGEDALDTWIIHIIRRWRDTDIQ